MLNLDAQLCQLTRHCRPATDGDRLGCDGPDWHVGSAITDVIESTLFAGQGKLEAALEQPLCKRQAEAVQALKFQGMSAWI
jgi:hypothetical protein